MHEFKLQRLMTDIFKHKLMCYIRMPIIILLEFYICNILYNMMSTKHTKRFVCSKSKQDEYNSQT